MLGKCALCYKDSELKESHIVPKFVYTWLKESSPSAIRNNHEPNKRAQDGIKKYLLCGDCERMFSQWEKPFYEQIFTPIHENSILSTPIKYGPWALKFAVSVSWRVLTNYTVESLSHYSDEQKKLAQKALKVWHDFLLDQIPHPDEFEQHLIPLEALGDYHRMEISPFLNRFILRSVVMDIICTEESAMVFTKMGHIVLFGIIQINKYHHWKGTKLHVKKGLIMPTDYIIPEFIYRYLNKKADENSKVLASISDKQKHKVQEALLDNADKVAHSEVFRAMQYDVYYSGEEAFTITEPEENHQK